MRIFSSFTPSTHPTISHPGGRKLGQVCKTLAISCGLAFMAYTTSTSAAMPTRPMRCLAKASPSNP